LQIFFSAGFGASPIVRCSGGFNGDHDSSGIVYDNHATAGFWIKLLAAALDVIVVAVLVNLVHIAALLVPLLAVYFVEMWTLKGKTIGGIICVLRLVRLDARPVDWGIATVCSLSRSFRYSWRGSGLSGSHLMMGDNLGTIRLPAPWWSVRQKVDR
tara:strand:- start:3128 stop:3595 length:468 start_codon:yes stop_codon:yes gene_type:complete